MRPSRRHILLIEDNRDVRSALASFFGNGTDFVLHVATNLADAGGHAGRNFVDVVVFDLGQGPEMAARLDMIRSWRDGGVFAPIIATSAQTYDRLLVDTLDAGADDLLRKPYLFREMEAKIQRHLARRQSVAPFVRKADGVELPEQAFEFAGARISPDLRIYFPSGFDDRLNPKQLGILQELASHAGKLILKQDLIFAVWGKDANVNSASVNQYLHLLRRLYRAGGADLDRYITPESKVGWRISEDAVPPQP